MNDNKVAVITGASSGIGFETTLGLAKDGFKIIALGRNAGRIEAAKVAIGESVRGARIDWIRADLSSMAEVRQAAQKIAELTGHINVLINNAGQILGEKTVTVDGLEQTFAGNVLAPFLLTGILLPLMSQAGQGHVVTTASVGHSFIDDMFWDDIQFEQEYHGAMAYLQSKLGNILFTRELARRHPEIISSAIHPGTVQSNFPDSADDQTKAYFAAAIERGELVSPKQAADTLLWLARESRNALPSGGYFYERKRIEPSEAASNDASAMRLWQICEELVGVAY
jgi:NAD(P)-dependent dehydrogenase (short-subunit alcohol dehydrogenase family)